MNHSDSQFEAVKICQGGNGGGCFTEQVLWIEGVFEIVSPGVKISVLRPVNGLYAWMHSSVV